MIRVSVAAGNSCELDSYSSSLLVREKSPNQRNAGIRLKWVRSFSASWLSFRALFAFISNPLPPSSISDVFRQLWARDFVLVSGALSTLFYSEPGSFGRWPSKRRVKGPRVIPIVGQGTFSFEKRSARLAVRTGLTQFSGVL